MVGLISLLTFAATFNFHSNWDELVEAAISVTEGRPHWRAYQNRLLGPYTVTVMDMVIHSAKASLLLFTAIGLLAHNMQTYFSLRSQNNCSVSSLAAVLAWSFLFITLQHRWLFTWDMFDILLFNFAAYILIFQRNPNILLYIFPLSLVNRESALLIPIAYIIACSMPNLRFSINPLDLLRQLPIKNILIGLGLILVGAIYTKFIRDLLFIEQTWGGTDEINALLGNKVNIFQNLEFMFYKNFFTSNIFHTILVWSFVMFCFFKLFLTNNVGIRAGVCFFFVLFINILIFGKVNETRMWLPLLPIVIYVYFAEKNHQVR